MFASYTGLLFDLFIFPLLLWKRTRTIAIILCITFHVSNYFNFSIGTFPLTMLGTLLLFIDSKTIRKWFSKIVGSYISREIPSTKTGKYKQLTVYLLAFFVILQLTIPTRHWFITGRAAWTEEGHRFSWRMMLRHKTCSGAYLVKRFKNRRGIFGNAWTIF